MSSELKLDPTIYDETPPKPTMISIGASPRLSGDTHESFSVKVLYDNMEKILSSIGELTKQVNILAEKMDTMENTVYDVRRKLDEFET